MARGLLPSRRRKRTQRNNPDGSITITDSEYVGEVGASEEFAVTSLPLNPGLKASFPKLSNIAKMFERYSMEALAFRVLPSVAATIPGLAHLAGDPDPLDPAPVDKRQMMGLPISTRAQIWQPFVANLRQIGRASCRERV